MLKVLTVAELAEDAFVKRERVIMLEMSQTPQDYQERKRAFIALAAARAAANEAEALMLAAINKNRTPSNDDGTKTPLVA